MLNFIECQGLLGTRLSFFVLLRLSKSIYNLINKTKIMKQLLINNDLLFKFLDV